MIWIYLFLNLLVLAFGVIYIAFIWEHIQNVRNPNRILYHASATSVLEPLFQGVMKRYQVDPSYHFVELGAGMATVALMAAHLQKWQSVRAVEVGPVVRLLGRLRSGFSRRITWVAADILSYQNPQPSLIYCYLSTNLLNKLHQNGQLTGQLVLCLSFEIQGVEPTEVIELPNWQSPLRVYDFR